MVVLSFLSVAPLFHVTGFPDSNWVAPHRLYVAVTRLCSVVEVLTEFFVVRIVVLYKCDGDIVVDFLEVVGAVCSVSLLANIIHGFLQFHLT